MWVECQHRGDGAGRPGRFHYFRKKRLMPFVDAIEDPERDSDRGQVARANVFQSIKRFKRFVHGGWFEIRRSGGRLFGHRAGEDSVRQKFPVLITCDS